MEINEIFFLTDVGVALALCNGMGRDSKKVHGADRDEERGCDDNLEFARET